MPKWPLKVEACSSCTGSKTEYSYGGRKMCVRCYKLSRRIDDADNVTMGTDLSQCVDFRCAHNIDENQRSIWRDCVKTQIRRKMKYLRAYEQYRRLEIQVSGLDIEEKIDGIANMLKYQALPRHHANYFNDNLSESGRRVVYALLCEIYNKKTQRPGWHAVNVSLIQDTLWPPPE